ncbi:O-antigen ligase family protein [Acidicapsa acidisoli]|uniref:O-antigen ligase family protein n=1 Tax=Acidicapsa acidisoli TaxID=1615681 RepID=UPI0021DFA3F8|nr:O-antigen ligase family protein [Acidicapsa acidisoli]
MTSFSYAAPQRSSRFLHAPASALILWTCLWVNLNTGLGNILPPSNLNDWQLCIRACLPYAVLPLSAFLLLGHKKIQIPRSAPSRLLMVYGVFAALSAIYSPDPQWSLYWSMDFLATILVAWTFVDRRNPVGSVRQMLQVTWVATFVVAAIIGYQARNSVFGETATGYGVLAELNGLSRSSGVARWAAVPGLVCLVRAYHSRRVSLFLFFICASAASFFIVYRMQSRGAVFGSVAALLFALLVSSRMRRYALPFAVLAILVIFLLDTPAALSDQIATYLERGQSREEFLSMTGRTRAYEHGLVAFEDSPLFGRGQWTDRLTIGEHVHNSYLQALLNAGIAGGIPYFVSWFAGWILFFRVHKRSDRLSPEDRICVLESGTVMMFFTVRAIPETTTASFAVDLLVMVAVYVYLETLSISLVRRSLVRRAPVPSYLYVREDAARLRAAG